MLPVCSPHAYPPCTRVTLITAPRPLLCSYTFLLDTALAASQPLLLVGPTGTGKSVYVGRHLVGGGMEGLTTFLGLGLGLAAPFCWC